PDWRASSSKTISRHTAPPEIARGRSTRRFRGGGSLDSLGCPATANSGRALGALFDESTQSRQLTCGLSSCPPPEPSVGEGEIWMRRNRAALLWGFAFCLASAADMQAEDGITIAYPYWGITHITRVGSPPDFPRNVKIHVVEDRPDAPVISGMPAAGCKLWPPNRKLVQVAVVTADDALSGLAADSL